MGCHLIQDTRVYIVLIKHRLHLPTLFILDELGGDLAPSAAAECLLIDGGERLARALAAAAEGGDDAFGLPPLLPAPPPPLPNPLLGGEEPSRGESGGVPSRIRGDSGGVPARFDRLAAAAADAAETLPLLLALPPLTLGSSDCFPPLMLPPPPPLALSSLPSARPSMDSSMDELVPTLSSSDRGDGELPRAGSSCAVCDADAPGAMLLSLSGASSAASEGTGEGERLARPGSRFRLICSLRHRMQFDLSPEGLGSCGG
jgi:hypothetical protein